MFKKIRPFSWKDMQFVYVMLPEKKYSANGQLRRQQRRGSVKGLKRSKH